MKVSQSALEDKTRNRSTIKNTEMHTAEGHSASMCQHLLMEEKKWTLVLLT